MVAVVVVVEVVVVGLNSPSVERRRSRIWAIAGSTGLSGFVRVLFLGAIILMSTETTYLVLLSNIFKIFED